jgi:hemerythrin-like metal-binding protein
MPVIQWSTDFELDQPVMDDTHREFVECLNRLAEAPAGDLPARLDDFIAHTEAHFAQEDRWMEELEFPPIGCHMGEHANVLEVAREVRRRVAAGETQFAQTLAEAMAEWFPHHAQTMDAMLAHFIREKGYTPKKAA